MSTIQQRIRRLAKGLYYEANRRVIKWGLRPAGQAYTRFIILGQPRVGSTLLTTALEQHSRTIMFGEIFRKYRSVMWQPRFGFRNFQSGLLAYTDMNEFMQQVIFRAYPPILQAVGLKIFYNHALEPPRNQLWSVLLGDKALHVIHLRRRNLLKRYLSVQLAQRSSKWRVTDDSDPGSDHRRNGGHLEPIRLDFDSCLRSFATSSFQAERFNTLFTDHPIYHLWYEDLAREYEHQITQIESFLGLPIEPIQPLTKKQSKLPLSQQIENYAELKAGFAGSEWAWFFEE